MAVLMTVDLANKLIGHYEKCIAEVATCEDVMSAISVCDDYDTERGICACAMFTFNAELYPCDWLKQLLTDESCQTYVLGIPKRAKTTAEVVDRLQYRVDLLKSFIQRPPTLP